jgi:hypothetical protein
MNYLIPESIEVNGVTYTVVREKDLMRTHEALGYCDYITARIVLDADLDGDRLYQVFVHEFVHALFFESGYDEHDEDMINRLGITLHNVLKNGGI